MTSSDPRPTAVDHGDRRNRSLVTLTVVLVLLVVPSPASAEPATVVSLQRVNEASPLAGACAANDRTLVYGFFGDDDEVEDETAIAVHPTEPNRLAVGWLQDGGLGIVVASTTDGGKNWHRTIAPGWTTCTGGTSDRVLHTRMAYAPDGTLYLAATPVDGFFPDPRSGVSRIGVARSFDGGATWSSPAFLEPAAVLNDFDTIATEPGGAIDVVWSPVEAAVEPIVLSRSTDHGQTWTHHEVRGPRPASIAFNRVVAAADGSLLVVTLDVPLPRFAGAPVTGSLTATRSIDAGATWSTPLTIADGIDADDWPMAAVLEDGTILAGWRQSGLAETAFRIARSVDHGATWSAPHAAFTHTPTSSVVPEMAAGPSGVAIVYYDGGADEPGDEEMTSEVRLALSQDAGVTWHTSRIAGYDHASRPYLGRPQGLDATPDGFMAAFPMGSPAATIGPSDAFVARIVKAETP